MIDLQSVSQGFGTKLRAAFGGVAINVKGHLRACMSDIGGNIRCGNPFGKQTGHAGVAQGVRPAFQVESIPAAAITVNVGVLG